MRKLVFLVPSAVTITLPFTINIPSPFFFLHTLLACTGWNSALHVVVSPKALGPRGPTESGH